MARNSWGIIGCIIGFIGLALPWWTLDFKSTGVTSNVSMYLYQSTTSGGGSQSFSFPVDWYNWTALGLLLVGCIITLWASVFTENGRMMLLGGGVMALLSLVVFAAGLQASFSGGEVGILRGIGLFSSGSIGGSVKFSSYLTFGFWLATAAMFFMMLGWTRYPAEEREEDKPEEPEPPRRPAPSPYVRRPYRRGYPY
jgi:hypothetical protein